MEKGRQITLDNIAKMYFRSLSNAISKKVLKEFKKAQGFVQNMGRKGAAKISNKIQGGGSLDRGVDWVTDGMQINSLYINKK